MDERLSLEYPDDFDHPAKIEIEKILGNPEEATSTANAAFATMASLVEQHHTESVKISAGPLPPAQELAEYERVCNGAADRIIRMAERQSEHRQQMEQKMLDAAIESDKTDAANEYKLGRFGSVFAFIICLAIVGVGGFCLYNGNNIAGFATVVAGLVPIASVFVYSKRKPKQTKENTLEDGPNTKEHESGSAELIQLD